jgi:hypothetical protein
MVLATVSLDRGRLQLGWPPKSKLETMLWVSSMR